MTKDTKFYKWNITGY